MSILVEGSHRQWLGLLTSAEDVDATFQTMADAGIKVARTWVSAHS